jgi:transcriptional regulator with XRE-family HTH domain
MAATSTAAFTPTLLSLANAHRMTREQLALKVGVHPLLLQRVDQGRQPLRFDIVQKIAIVTGEQIGDVLAAVRQTIHSGDDRLLNPQPPIPLFGDVLPPLVLKQVPP